ncbi:Predicted metalloprotease [Geodermatophilus obscurus]|uniref:Predicted metalloprotease n=1 Tax=Geodermatophilus obscurus TaxID=1861 RepID=A0A1I5F0L8_9ACTN|nr:hypothetical protein [Geodermatophilus obscurus]SFO17314.1 Predicted metalloprotease [Geodermatophilus obscurus]
MRVPRRVVALLAAGLTAGPALSGCATVIAGTAFPPGGPRTDATDADVRVHLADPGDDTDRIARNAIADVLTWWERTFPELFGGDLGAIDGGFWSVDPDETDPGDLPDGGCFGEDVADLAGNAYYCGEDDVVVYDRAWVAGLADEYGPFMVAEIMAHEIAHAVQAHAGIDAPSIVAETQAECFAGAWTRWVADGSAAHVTVREEELDPYLLGYLYFGDAAGTAPDDPDAHGSLFDQLSAFQEGYAEGPRTCAAFDRSRVYTERAADPSDGGDRSHREMVAGTDDLLATFWRRALTTGFPGTAPLGGRLREPAVRSVGGLPCPAAGEALDLYLCPADGSVRYDSAGLLRPAHDDVGDFAVTTLLALPYALAVRGQLGLPVDDPAAVRAAVCVAGWLAREMHLGHLTGTRLRLAPGDVDEAAVVLLRYATGPAVVPGSGPSGFELVDAFRQGFTDGGDACGLRR